MVFDAGVPKGARPTAVRFRTRRAAVALSRTWLVPGWSRQAQLRARRALHDRVGGRLLGLADSEPVERVRDRPEVRPARRLEDVGRDALASGELALGAEETVTSPARRCRR